MAPISEKLKAEFDALSALPEAEQEEYADLIDAFKLMRLRKEIRKGLDQLDAGLGTPLDMQEIKRKARERWEASRTSP